MLELSGPLAVVAATAAPSSYSFGLLPLLVMTRCVQPTVDAMLGEVTVKLFEPT